MRAAVFVFWALIILAVLWPLLRRRRLRPAPGETGSLDELVKDPVCQTYVVRSRAIRRAEGDALRYFCSADCARRYRFS